MDDMRVIGYLGKVSGNVESLDRSCGGVAPTSQ
jgi:hypothetical protein